MNINTELQLSELASELQRQQSAKRDFKVPSKRMFIDLDNRITIDGIGEFGMNEVFHKQFAGHHEIPQRYYDRIRSEMPSLHRQTVNAHLTNADDIRLVRTLDGNARAYLSNGYRPLDNVDLVVRAIIPALQKASAEAGMDMSQFRITGQVTDTKLYVKVVNPMIEGEVNVGDVVQSGVIIKNSEVGFSSVSVEQYIWRLACKNGMISGRVGRKFHSGSRSQDVTDEAKELISSDRTRFLKDATVWSEVQDMIMATMTQEHFDKVLKPMQDASGYAIERNIVEVAQEVSATYQFNKEESDMLLNNLIGGGDMTQWGLINAVTAIAHNVGEYDRAVELQEIGGKILALPEPQVKGLLIG